MITGIFGVPGAGKTTILAYYSKKYKKKYDNIYTINCEIKGTKRIKWKDLSIYKFTNSLILIDEITLDADNRKFKEFDDGARDFFILHRHLNTDVIYVTQNFEGVDKKIRDLTAELWYMSKTVVPIFSEITRMRKIYRKININENTSELTLGYRFCNRLESIFASNNKFIIRRLYYKLFDTNELLTLEKRREYNETSSEELRNIMERNFGS